MFRRGTFCYLILLCLAVILTTCRKSERRAFRPNVVLISIDALRADHTGFMGYGRNTTPNLDELAQRGIIFDCAITPAPSTYALFSVLTGRELSSFACKDYINKGLHIEKSFPPLILNFKNGDYATAAIVNNLNLRPETGLNRGFDYYSELAHVASTPPVEDSPPTAADVTETAIAWLSEKSSKPFFLWLHYFDPHHPYDPPPPFDTVFETGFLLGRSDEALLLRNKSVAEQTRFYEEINLRQREITEEQLQHLIGLYDGEIAYTDQEIGRFLAELRRLGCFENTLIIVTADHGEEFLDHGGMLHAYTMYDELVRVPLLFHFPNAGDIIAGKHAAGKNYSPRKSLSAQPLTVNPPIAPPRGRNIKSQVSTMDILATVLDLLDTEIPPGVQGKSLKKVLLDKHEAGRPAVIEAPLLWYAYRTTEWKLVVDWKNKRRYLYNLKNDPGEERNLFNGMNVQSRKMVKLLGVEARVEQVSRRTSAIVKNHSVNERLKALGYLK